MPTTLEALSREAMILPPEQRLQLARELLNSVDVAPEPRASAAWESELAKRIAEVDEGRVSNISASEVFARLRTHAPSR
jgi:putative addiction module component (TIGR02574 family)